MSISRKHWTPQQRAERYAAGWCFLAPIFLTGAPVNTHAAASASCIRALGAPTVILAPLKTVGSESVTADLSVAPEHTWLIEVGEQGNDAVVEVLESKGQVLARSDHPERRTGTQRAVISAATSPMAVRVTGQEQAGIGGTAIVRAYDLEALRSRPECLMAFRSLAAADVDYAAGREISSGRVTSPANSAREVYLRAADGYAAAERALTDPGDRALRGATQLALAGVRYSGLQDWAGTAEWAMTATKTLTGVDTYRRARADALLAAALIEIGSSTSAGQRVPAFDEPAEQILARARRIFRSLSHFHMQRGERYDAGLQLNNIAVTYLYGGHYTECAAASLSAGRVFASIHETLREALATQNRALCLWGLGRLPEALTLLERALPDLNTGSVPVIYIGALNNTALANFALGHFDESLRQFDRALDLAQKGQWRRDEGQSLYGIGINYYALGDRERALQFLERSLARRTEAADGRGRMQTLRALATTYADWGRVADALSADGEALSLAVAPSAIERIKIQTASHTAAAGHHDEALAQLDALLATDPRNDALIRAEARLQRAQLLREVGRPREALRDLTAAQPGLHGLGIMYEFEADLERARALRAAGEPHAALAAVERALSRSDAVRMQSANPELRAQLQTPLRPAYDLKLDLLRGQYDQAVAGGRKAQVQKLAIAAFLTADASRAQSLADVAAHRYPAAVRAALARGLRQRDALYRELAGRRFALDARLDASGSHDPRAHHLMQDIAELERQIDTVNSSIATRTLPEVPNARPVGRPALPLLPDGTAVVSYWLGSESAYAWVLTSAGIQWVRLGPSAAIAERSAALQRSLTRLVDIPLERRMHDARALYGLILQPMESGLVSARRWIIVPDGALDYIPFAVLRGPEGPSETFVAMQHDIAVTPAVWLLGTEPPAPRHRVQGLLLVADPVYREDDPRLASLRKTVAATGAAGRQAEGTAQPGYGRLPYTAVEAKQISEQFPAGQIDELTGLDATRERLLSLDWSRYRFIHIATHGIADAQVPELSALILGSFDSRGEAVDGAVRVADLSLQSLNADVVVFSACDTALGKQMPSEGLLGLGSMALARGARAVVASLWPVADEIGARLMTDFYRHLLHDGMSGPAALGAAMRSVITHDRAADPALWGAFQVSVATLEPERRNAGTAPLATRLQEKP